MILLIVNGFCLYETSLAEFSLPERPDECGSVGQFMKYGPDFRFAKVKGSKNSKVYFYGDSDGCPMDGEAKCREKEHLVPGNRVLVARRFGPWICGWYVPRDGQVMGWIAVKDLELAALDQNPIPEKWIGTWRSRDNSLIITRHMGGGLELDGEAVWRGLGINRNYGAIAAYGNPQGTEFQLKENDCELHLRLIDDVIIAGDNFRCGGGNVRFDGVYQKENSTIPPDTGKRKP